VKPCHTEHEGGLAQGGEPAIKHTPSATLLTVLQRDAGLLDVDRVQNTLVAYATLADEADMAANERHAVHLAHGAPV
jgi:hypothetical protein